MAKFRFKRLTLRQREVFDFIEKFIAEVRLSTDHSGDRKRFWTFRESRLRSRERTCSQGHARAQGGRHTPEH